MCLDWRVVAGLALVTLLAELLLPRSGAVAILLAGAAIWLASRRYVIRRKHGPWCAARTRAAHRSANEGVAGRSLLALQARLMSVRAEEAYLVGEITRLQVMQRPVTTDRWPRSVSPERRTAETGPPQVGQPPAVTSGSSSTTVAATATSGS